MFSSWYYILFNIVFVSVNVHSHETTDKTHDVTKRHGSRVAPGNEGKMLLKSKRNVEDFDEVGDRVLHDDISVYQGAQQIFAQDELQSNSERDEEASDDDDADDGSEDDYKIKALQTGDTFTPLEMLPITTKLLKKVQVGEGRGIVSSAKSPEELADKLFGAYFLTTRRIVHLTDNDISGLDALQALALDGEAVKMRTSGDSYTEKPEETFLLNGQLVGLDQGRKRCHYKLLFKKVRPSDSGLRKGKTGRIPPFDKILKLEKKMSPNRHLIINHKGRKSNKKTIISKTGVRAENNSANDEEVEVVKKGGEQKKHKVSKEGKKKVKKLKSRQKHKHRQKKTGLARNKKLKKQRKHRKKNRKPKFTEKLKHLRNKNIDLNLPLTTTQRPVCKWRYICRVRGDLDTCRLHTSCLDGQNNNPMLDNKYVDTENKKNKEQEELVLHFRKMLGLTALDEDVERIIEQHVLLVKPKNMKPDYKIETLDEYFNNIIMAQQTSTTPGVAGGSYEDFRIEPHHILGLISEITPEMEYPPPSYIRYPQNLHILSESTMITTPRYNKKYVM